jgi:hypothetical protein
MLSSISWNQYISGTLFLLAFYYAFVGYKYFRWEVLSLIGIRKVEKNETAVPVADLKKQFTASNHTDYLPKENLYADISPVVQSFTDEVKAFVSGANSNIPKPELIFSLQLITSKYPALKDADCKDELTAFVFTEVNNKFSGLLEQTEAKQIWV